MQSYQFEQISADPDKPLSDSTRPLDTADMERYVSNLSLSECDTGLALIIQICKSNTFVWVSSNYHFTSCIDRLKDVQSLDELGDVYNHFLLYYGRDIPKMQNAAKSGKKKLKKIKEVSEEDGTEIFSLN